MTIFKYIYYIEQRGVIIGASGPSVSVLVTAVQTHARVWTLRLKLMTVGLSQTGGPKEETDSSAHVTVTTQSECSMWRCKAGTTT